MPHRRRLLTLLVCGRLGGRLRADWLGGLAGAGGRRLVAPMSCAPLNGFGGFGAAGRLASMKHLRVWVNMEWQKNVREGS